jgi:hypothetical protein
LLQVFVGSYRTEAEAARAHDWAALTSFDAKVKTIVS